MRYLSLFTGIGGFEKGIEQAEYSIAKKKAIIKGVSYLRYSECVGYSEIDKYAIQTYQKHYPDHKNYGDITKIDETLLPDPDLIVGGFPCQSFSIAGKRGGFADTRGTLFFDIARIVKAKQPRLLLLENVKGLLSHDQGRTFRVILSTLDELGYDIQWQVLNSKDFGVPQTRERVFVVGHLRGTPRPEVFPLGEVGGIPHGENGTEERRIIQKSGNNAASEKYKETKNIGALKASNQSNPRSSGTSLIAEKGSVIRRLTPVECERLQGFPDNWTAGVSDTQRYKQCGNAVTVNVVRAVMEQILSELNES